MKSIQFEYGKKGLDIKIDPSWNTTVIKPETQEKITNPIEALRNAIQNPLDTKPLKDLVKNKEMLESICIVVSDATRPVPSHLIIDSLIIELENLGVTRNMITILIATGLHRPSNNKEIQRIVGKKYYNKINVINHNARDENCLQQIEDFKEGIPIAINKVFLKSDLKIITGYVEPHFFFGFSGGSKAIIPGIAGKNTIMLNHSAENIASTYSRFGIYENNSMIKMSSDFARKIGIDFTINVCIDEDHHITKVAAGKWERVHKTLIDYQLEYAFTPIKESFDIVICGNGGYPLDLNLYQAVKSMAIGEMAVKQGGTIISVNECSDGIGIGQEDFKELLFSGMTPKEIYEKVLKKKIVVPDQWEIQVLTRVMQKADIYVISELREKDIGNIGLKYAITVEDAINEALNVHGNRASILFLPNGPQVLPKLI